MYTYIYIYVCIRTYIYAYIIYVQICICMGLRYSHEAVHLKTNLKGLGFWELHRDSKMTCQLSQLTISNLCKETLSYIYIHIWVFPKNRGVKPPKHPMFNRVFHYFHHPFWGAPIFGNTHVFLSSKDLKSAESQATQVSPWWVGPRRDTCVKKVENG